VDRLTWTDYEEDLERNLEDLHDRILRGAYRALITQSLRKKTSRRQRAMARLKTELGELARQFARLLIMRSSARHYSYQRAQLASPNLTRRN